MEEICMENEILEVLPKGAVSQPLFPTQKEYNAFRDDFIASVGPEQERWRLARAESVRASRDRWIY